MAHKRISELNQAPEVKGTDTFAIVRGGQNLRTTVSRLALLLGSPDLSGTFILSVGGLTGDVTVGTGLGVDGQEINAQPTLDALASTAPGKGTEMVGYRAPVTGASGRGLTGVIYESGLSPADMPSYDDTPGADNTQAVIDAAAALGNSRGVVRIPAGTVFDKSTVMKSSSVPTKTLFEDNSGVNGGYPGDGVTGRFEKGDATSADDTTFMLSSGHNPTLTLDNSALAGSPSGQGRTMATYYTGGNCQKGALPKLRRNISSFEFAVGSSDEWAYQIRAKAPAAALDYNLPNHGYWRWASGVSTVIGEFCVHNAGGALRYYKATTAGTTGAAPPTHASGTVSDGGVSWEYYPFNYDQTVFRVSEFGRIGVNSAPGSGVFARYRSSEFSPTAGQLWQFEPVLANGSVIFDFYPTDGSANPVANPVRLIANTSGLSFFTGGVNRGGFDANGLSLRGLTLFTPTNTDGDTTPSVAGISSLRVINSSPTRITTFDDGVNNQWLELVFGDGNSTLGHGSGLILEGGVDLTATTHSVVTLRKYSSTSAWVEVSRSIK